MKHLFITGLYRSGTTLVEKLLHNHDDLCVGSQPFPALYHQTKKLYLDSRQLTRRYPLGGLFLEDDYRPADFNAFLETTSMNEAFVAETLSSMVGYDGQLMPDFLTYCLKQPPLAGLFFEVFVRLLSMLPDHLACPEVTYAGSKEIFCEEYVPLLLSHGVKTLVVMRDPRDIVMSLNYGQGVKHGGNIRPTLFIMRQWRELVSTCLEFDGHPDFMVVIYEHLTQDPWATLDRMTEFLGVPIFQRDQFSHGIYSQNGELWRGNSSFSDFEFISPDSIGKFKHGMSEDTLRYIETVCYPELRAMGYELHALAGGPAESTIGTFREPFEVTHRGFEPGYSSRPEHVQEELERLRVLSADPGLEQQARWFIFPRAYQRLKKNFERHAS